MTKEEKLKALKTALNDYRDVRDGISPYDNYFFSGGFCFYFANVHDINIYTVFEEMSEIPELYDVEIPKRNDNYFYKPGDIESRIDHLERTIEYIKNKT